MGLRYAYWLAVGVSLEYSFRVSGVAGHGDEGMLNAYVCFDSKKYSDEVQNHKMMLNDLKRKAAEIECKDPVARFKKIAGKAIKHFDVQADGKKAIVR